MLVVECYRRFPWGRGRTQFFVTSQVKVTLPEAVYEVRLKVPQDAEFGEYEWRALLRFRSGYTPPLYARAKCLEVVEVKGSKFLLPGGVGRCEVRIKGETRGLVVWAGVYDEVKRRIVAHGETRAFVKERECPKGGWEGISVAGVDIPEGIRPGSRYRRVAFVGLPKEGKIAPHLPMAWGNGTNVLREASFEGASCLPSDTPGLIVPLIVEEDRRRAKACINRIYKGLVTEKSLSLEEVEKRLWTVNAVVPLHLSLL